MTGIALYSPYRNFPEALLKRTDQPLKVRFERDGETNQSRYILGLRNYEITLNLMSEAQLPENLDGFCTYIRTIYGGKPDKRGDRIIQQIKRTKLAIGFVFSPPNAPFGPPLQVASVIAEMTRSIVFINGTLLDYADNVILAPDGKFDKNATIEVSSKAKPWWKFW